MRAKGTAKESSHALCPPTAAQLPIWVTKSWQRTSSPTSKIIISLGTHSRIITTSFTLKEGSFESPARALSNEPAIVAIRLVCTAPCRLEVRGSGWCSRVRARLEAVTAFSLGISPGPKGRERDDMTVDFRPRLGLCLLRASRERPMGFGRAASGAHRASDSSHPPSPLKGPLGVNSCEIKIRKRAHLLSNDGSVTTS